MAKIVEVSDGNNKFPNSIFSKTHFLTSIRDFKPDGVKMGVEKVSRVFPVKQDPKKAQVAVELCIMDDMDKCRVFVLDDEGEYVLNKDELTGEESRKITIKPIKKEDLEMFTIFLPCGTPETVDNEADLTLYPTSSAYPLFKVALQEAGELPEDMGDKPFVTNQIELKEALEGFTFLGKCEEIKGKYNYVRLQVEAL